MTQFPEQKCVMLIAGEVSGDQHGAKLVRAMREKDPNLFFCGIGSHAMRAAGVRILVDSNQIAVVGITEILASLNHILAAYGTVKRVLQGMHPDLLILIDFPGFNMRVAALARRFGIPVLYYISPQVWAWRPGRVKKLKKLVDHMAVILPFEEDFYHSHGVPVTFVGHPLLDDNPDKPVTLPVEPSPENVVIGLLPGSRRSEISRILPVQLEAAGLLRANYPNLGFILSVAPSMDKEVLESYVRQFNAGDFVELSTEPVEIIFKRCTLAVAASGTVTLEAAIHETPLIIVYRVSAFSARVAKLLVHVQYIGLVNLIAGEQVAPELVQEEATPDNITRHVSRLLEDSQRLKRVKDKLKTIKAKLGGAGASQTTAGIALRLLGR
jgi:lipid-A-disaccharide synthase